MRRMAGRLLAWRLPMVLGVACLLLGSLVSAALLRSPPPQAVALPAATADAGGAESDERSFDAPPIESFRAVVERPVFSRSRRPAPPERTATAEARPGDNATPFLLSGVLIAGANRVAFLQPVAERKTLRVLEGESIEGWRVEKILPQRVVIGNGTIRAELTLQDRIAPATPGQQARETPPPLRPSTEQVPHDVPPEAPRPDEVSPEDYEGSLDHE